MINYDEYEKECGRIQEENDRLLAEYESWLQEKKLAEKTIRKHVYNVDFYINHYLLYDGTNEAKKGVFLIGGFLGYWFIRKAMWASMREIKANAASLKKFYTFMYENCYIDGDELDDLKETIHEEMLEWLATMERYDDPEITSSDEIWSL